MIEYETVDDVIKAYLDNQLNEEQFVDAWNNVREREAEEAMKKEPVGRPKEYI